MRFLIHQMLLILTLGLLLTGCFKQSELTAPEKEALFQISDVKNLNLSGFVTEKYRNGSDYYYQKQESALNGLSCMFGNSCTNSRGQRIKITTYINIQSTAERAARLYSGSAKISVVNQKGFKKLNHQGWDEGFYHQINELYTITLRKSKLYYSVQLEAEGFENLTWDDFSERIKQRYERTLDLYQKKL